VHERRLGAALTLYKLEKTNPLWQQPQQNKYVVRRGGHCASARRQRFSEEATTGPTTRNPPRELQNKANPVRRSPNEAILQPLPNEPNAATDARQTCRSRSAMANRVLIQLRSRMPEDEYGSIPSY
jgi:hypothetical protein